MNAVILAGGVRSGQELSGSGLPRALWPFPDQPLIFSVLRFALRFELGQLAICANGKTKLIAAELAGGPFPALHFSEDTFPRGPAGCLKDLEGWLGSEPFVVLQGTACYDFDLAAMVAGHVACGAAITVGAVPVRTISQASYLQPAGVYVMNPEVLSSVNSVGYQDIKEQLLPKVRERGLAVRCHVLAGQQHLIHGCGHYLEALPLAIQIAADRPDSPMVHPQGGLYVHPSARVAASARIAGPVWIDRNATVGEDAVILGPAIIGPQASIGRNALLNRVVAMRDTRVPEEAQLANTILPPGGSVCRPAIDPRQRGAERSREVSPARPAASRRWDWASARNALANW